MRIDYNKVIIILNLVLIIFVGCLLCSHAEKNFNRHQPLMHRMEPGRIFDALKLTKEQKDQLEANRGASRERNDVFMKEMQGKRLALAKELGLNQVDMVKVKTLHTELKEATGRFEDALLQDILQVRKILGPEKFCEFTEKIVNADRGGRPSPGFPPFCGFGGRPGAGIERHGPGFPPREKEMEESNGR